MALTGKLLADFSSFQDAVTKAEAKLVDFGKGAGNAGTALNRMVDNFSGRKLIQDATLMAEAVERIGGTSKLTASELARVTAQAGAAADKLRAMGETVPPKIQAIADATKKAGDSWGDFVKGFNIQDAIANPLGVAKTAAFALAESIGGVALAAAATVASLVAVGLAVFKIAADAAAVGAALDDMADQTGMSVPALSKLSTAAKVIGADMNTLTGVIFKLEKGIGDNTDAFQAGLTKMGLSTAELKAAGPDHYLELVTVGLNNIVDPSERASAGAAVLGKQYKDVAAALVDLAAGFELTKDIEPWTAEQAAAAEKFEQQMKSIVIHAEALGTGIGRWLIEPVSTFVSGIISAGKAVNDWIDLTGGVLPMLHRVAEAWRTAAAAIDVFRGAQEKLPKITGDASKGVEAWRKSVAGLALTVPTLNAALLTEEFASKDLARTHAELKEAHDKAAAAAKKHAAELDKQKEELKKVTAEVHKLEGGLFLIPDALSKIGRSYDESKLGKLADEVLKIEQAAHVANFGFKGMADGLEHVGEKVNVSIHDIDRFITSAAKLKTALAKTFQDLPKTVADALIGGGGISGALKAFAVQLGVDFATALNESIAKSVKAGGSGVTALGQKSAGAIGALAGIGAAASGASAKTAVAAVAMTGLSVAAGAIGAHATIAGAAALGVTTAGIGLAAVGAYFAIKHFLTNTEKQINPLREDFVQAAGGLDALNIKATEAGTNLWALLQAKNTQQYNKAITDLNKALDAYAQHKAHVTVGLKLAVAGSNDLAKALIDPLTELQKQLDDAFTKMEKGNVSLIKLLLKKPAKGDAQAAVFGQSLADQIFAAMGATAANETVLDALAKQIAQTITEVQPAFEHLGQYVAATFAAQIHEGASAFDAFTALAPAFEDLQIGVEQFGLTSTATIDQLLDIQKVVGVNKDVFASVQAITNIYDGLTEAGYVTKDLFSSFGQDLAHQFDLLISRGAPTASALGLLQPQLQRLWEGQQKFGDITDEATLALLRQAEEQGIVGEQMKGVNDKILDVLISIAEVFGATLPASINAFGTAIRNIPIPKPITIPLDYDGPVRNLDTYASMGGRVTASGVQYLGGGGNVLRMMPRGIDTQPVMMAVGEGVVSRRGMALLGDAGLSTINRGQAGGGSSTSSQSIVIIPIALPAGASSDQIIDALIAQLPAEILRNPGGVRSKLREALGFSSTTWTQAS